MTFKKPDFQDPRLISIIILVGTVLAGFICASIMGLGAHVFNVDERELLYSSADRFLGVPSTSLAWPAATIQLLLAPALMIVGCIGVLQDGSAGFSRVLSDLYSDPQAWITFTRVLQCTLYGLLSLSLVKSAHKIAGVNVVFPILALASVPIFQKQCLIIGGDVIATLGCTLALGISLASGGSRKEILKAAILFGIAIASRATFGIYMPLFLILIALQWRTRNEWHSEFKSASNILFTFTGASIASFVVFCPYAWIDPMRMLKSILGNAGRAGDTAELLDRLAMAFQQTGGVIWIIAISAIALGGWKGRLQSVLCFGFGAAILALLCKVGIIYDRYFLMLLPALILSIILSEIDFEPRGVKIASWVLGIASVFQFCFFVVPQIAGQIEPSQKLKQLDTILSEVEAGEPVYVDIVLLQFINLRRFSKASLHNQISLGAVGLANTTSSGQIPRGEGAASTLGISWNFVEDELAFQGRVSVIAYYAASGPNLVLFSYDKAKIERFNLGHAVNTSSGTIISSRPVPEASDPALSIKGYLYVYKN